MGTDYTHFVKQIHGKYDINLGFYKEEQMKRRLNSFKDKYQLDNFQALFHAVSDSDSIRQAFFDKMTINVTEFFRNRSRWQALIDLISNRWTTPKIWSAACSSGEEAYTLSIILNEIYKSGYQIDATDIDRRMLDHAKAGTYTKSSLRELNEIEIKKYFHKFDESYNIDIKFKKPIRFEKHNLLSDSYKNGYDLIVCRNVLIYFTDEAKDHVFRRFSASLNPGGILFVGSTEQIFNAKQYGLQAIGKFLYEKT